MSEAASYSVRDGIAVITMNNPPVNSLSAANRVPRRRRACRRRTPIRRSRRIVLIGSEKAFSGGAEIREFNTDKSARAAGAAGGERHAGRDEEAAGRGDRRLRARRRPRARARLPLPRRRAEGAARPARGEARHPARLGRHAAPAARGADGRSGADDDHRQPGLRRQGEAARPGGRDRCRAICWRGPCLCQETSKRKQSAHARIRDLPAKLDGDPKAFFAAARAEVAKASRGYPAPLEIVACAEAAATCPSTRAASSSASASWGWSKAPSRRRCATCSSPSARPRRFPTCPKTRRCARSRSAAVIGAGTMGGGIAMNFANAGIPVIDRWT